MLREQRLHRLAETILGGVEGALFDVVSGFRIDAHGCEDGGVKIHDANRILNCDERAFFGGGAVKVAFFHAAAKHDDG